MAAKSTKQTLTLAHSILISLGRRADLHSERHAETGSDADFAKAATAREAWQTVANLIDRVAPDYWEREDEVKDEAEAILAQGPT